AVPMVALEGFVTAQESGRRASRVQVYGVDNRFWQFHGQGDVSGPDAVEALLSDALSGELATAPGDGVVLRVERAAAIPVESLHGRKEDVGRSLRLTVRGVLPPARLGEFS